MLGLYLILAGFSSPPQSQSASVAYARIMDSPSKAHWCLPEAGDDPSAIISGRCKVYRECLDRAGLTEEVSSDALPKLKACHQSLYNAARTNPQIKGSLATQTWLTHDVQPGTEAKTFPVPALFPAPR